MNGLDEIGRAWVASWRVPDRRPIYEWASEHVFLPAGVYAEGAEMFNVQKSRYMISVFDALQDDTVSVVSVQWPVRTGKSLIGDVWMPWTLSNAPGPFMWNMNTDTLARRHARTRVLPVLRRVELLRDLLPSDPRQQTGQEVIFRNGVPLYIQCPSIDNLQGVGIRYLLEDELWTREAGRHQQAVARLGDYEKIGASKMLCAGQAGIEDDDMDYEFRRGHMAEWMVPCLECGVYFIPVTSGMRPDGTRHGLVWGGHGVTGPPDDYCRDKEGNFVWVRVLETLSYVAPCGHIHMDCSRTQAEWNRRGRYEAMNPRAAPEHKSFHIYATIARPWRLIAEDLVASLNALKGGIIDPMMIFTQKFDALPWSEMRLMQDLKSPTYEISSTWNEETLRTLVVDHQKDGTNWGLVAAISDKGEMRRLWYGKLIGVDDIKAKEAEFKPQYVFIDAAWDSKNVYQWCVLNGWFCLWGDERRSFTHWVGPKGHEVAVLRSFSKPQRGDPEIGFVGQNKRFAPLFYWSNPTIKDRVKRLRDLGNIIEPEVDPTTENEIAYKKQLRGQWRVLKKNQITGHQRWEWRDNGNDHAADCWCMTVVVMTMKRKLRDIENAPAEEPEKKAA